MRLVCCWRRQAPGERWRHVGGGSQHGGPELGLQVQHRLALEPRAIRRGIGRDGATERIRAGLCGSHFASRDDHVLVVHLDPDGIDGRAPAHQHRRDPAVLAAAAIPSRLGGLATRCAARSPVCRVCLPEAEEPGADEGRVSSHVVVGAVARRIAQRDIVVPLEGSPAVQQCQYAHSSFQQSRLRGVVGQRRRCVPVWGAGPRGQLCHKQRQNPLPDRALRAAGPRERPGRGLGDH
mmetsp:Transcript_26948/g.77611  ORF Transcript_26948/g.77611 Transcript_26948/m.77611 type:complete len:236 (-) Transcript_26948:82-789(-)